jgi:thioredoxin-related protein
MKKWLLILGFFYLGSALMAQGIDFFQGTWEDAVAEARKQDKIIFVDAYAVWCGPCKRMSANVFPNDKVGEFYNKNFINLKMDMEHGDENFRRKYPVSAYPTLMYIDYSGEVVHQVKGAMDVDAFIKLGETALSKIDRSKNFEEAYNEGNRDPQLVYDYVKALNQAGKPTLAISNEYLRTQKDLTTPENLRFILEAAVECDSRIFGMLVQNRAAIEKVAGAEAVRNRIETACKNTLRKAIEYQSPELLEEAKAAMQAHHAKETADLFAINADRTFAREMNDMVAFLKAGEAYAKLVGKEKPHELHKLARETMELFGDQPAAMKEAEKWAGMAAKESSDYTVHYTYAHLLYANGNKKGALKAAEKAMELAKEGPRGATEMVEELINRIKQG